MTVRWPPDYLLTIDKPLAAELKLVFMPFEFIMGVAFVGL